MPLCLITMALIASQRAPIWGVWLAGPALVAARLIRLFGTDRMMSNASRIAGKELTWLVTSILAGWSLLIVPAPAWHR